jgi:hypothetical protein
MKGGHQWSQSWVDQTDGHQPYFSPLTMEKEVSTCAVSSGVLALWENSSGDVLIDRRPEKLRLA